MAQGTVEYRISTHRKGEWRVLRQGIVMAIRNDLYDAVDIATHFAEREIGSIGTDARVVLERATA
jgi:hypothetical protein